jgi:putative ABC transport system permease protein
MTRLIRRLRTLARRSGVKDDIRRELDFHIDMEAEKRQRQGMTADEARRTALRDFGGMSRVREEVHDSRGLSMWDALTQDVRFSVRMLRRWPGYTAAVIFTLALGIGANTAIFSIVDNVLLEPLPYAEAEDLVRVVQSRVRPVAGETNVSIKELFDYREGTRSLDGLVEYHFMSFVLLNHGEPDRVDTGVVSSNFFDVFGVRPLHGRGFVDKDDDLGAEAVVLLSHAYWQKKFGGDTGVVGRVVEMNDKPHTIVGVLPPIPQYPRENDVYMPTSACPFRAQSETRIQENRRAFSALQVFGRLKPGASAEQARSEISTVAQRFVTDNPQVYNPNVTQFSSTIVGLNEELIEDARPILLALLATTTLVLLIACANVANLSLARMARRDREMALRLALGAGRGRLVRQLLTESTIMALAGGTLGLLVAWASLDTLAAFAARFTPRVIEPSLDASVLLFALGLSAVTGILFGIIPAISSRPSLTSALKEGGGQAGDGVKARRLRSALVVAQVTVCFALLVGAGLFLSSLKRLSSVDLGYRADRVLTAEVFGNWSRQQNDADSLRIYGTMLDRLKATPGVLSVAVTNAVPLATTQPGDNPIRIEGVTGDNPGQLPVADLKVASDGYFDVLGITPFRGRVFTMSDHREAPPVAVINASMAKLWGDRDPIGLRFQPTFQDAPWITVVGVIPDMRQYSVDREANAQYYLPFLQLPGIGGRVLIRTDGDPMSYVAALKGAVYAAHPEVPVEGIQTLEALRAGSLRVPGLNAMLLTVFATVALIITLAGVAAVIGTSVSQRTREFGVRMALGATRSDVLRMVLGQGLGLVTIGLVGGAVGAVLLARGIAAYLYQTPTTDPLVYVAVAAVFLVSAMLACLGPARRATSIDPLLALKAD